MEIGHEPGDLVAHSAGTDILLDEFVALVRHENVARALLVRRAEQVLMWPLAIQTHPLSPLARFFVVVRRHHRGDAVDRVDEELELVFGCPRSPCFAATIVLEDYLILLPPLLLSSQLAIFDLRELPEVVPVTQDHPKDRRCRQEKDSRRETDGEGEGETAESRQLTGFPLVGNVIPKEFEQSCLANDLDIEPAHHIPRHDDVDDGKEGRDDRMLADQTHNVKELHRNSMLP